MNSKAARFGKAPLTRDYHLASYVSEVAFNSSRGDDKFNATVEKVRRKAADRKFTAEQMRSLESAIASCSESRKAFA